MNEGNTSKYILHTQVSVMNAHEDRAQQGKDQKPQGKGHQRGDMPGRAYKADQDATRRAAQYKQHEEKEKEKEGRGKKRRKEEKDNQLGGGSPGGDGPKLVPAPCCPLSQDVIA